MKVSVAALGVACSALMACSSSSSTGSGSSSGPGIDPSTRLADLTPAERATLCDWSAQQMGGYDLKIRCDDGGDYETPPSQAWCVAHWALGPNCSATVGQAESCLQLGINSCDSPSVRSSPDCLAMTAPGCTTSSDAGTGSGSDSGPTVSPDGGTGPQICSGSTTADGQPADDAGACSTTVSWPVCSNGNTYEVDCSCPSATCVCKQNGTATGKVIAFTCPACTDPGPTWQRCGFPQ